MKIAFSVLIFCFFAFNFAACDKIENNKEDITACGVENPQKNLTWLNELIYKAETDKTGNYLGTIWLEKDNGNDIFVTDMRMGSGGIANYFFDCSGNAIIPDTPFGEMKLNIVVYTNIPL